MSLIYITGVAGSGKTTALEELKLRGYEAYDADDGFSGWEHTKTRERVPVNDHRLATDEEFFEVHDWYMDRESVGQLAKKAGDNTIFLCGSVANEDEVWDLFDRVFCLYVDDATLERRIMNRSDKDFGKAKHEFARIIKQNHAARTKYELLGAVIIDAVKSTDEVVDEILVNV